jgi:hypothetical protein
MAVVDLVVVSARQARHGFNVLVGIPDFVVLLVDTGGDTLAFQSAGDTVAVAARPQDDIMPDPHIQFAHRQPELCREAFHDRDFFVQFGLPPSVAFPGTAPPGQVFP